MRVPMNAPDMKELHSFAFMDQTGILTKLVSTLIGFARVSMGITCQRSKVTLTPLPGQRSMCYSARSHRCASLLLCS